MTADVSGRVAIVTGANHGIGAAIAEVLARNGVAVLATYLRADPGVAMQDRGPGTGQAADNRPATPASYCEQRARTADDVVEGIRTSGGTALAVEADLGDPAVPAHLFDAAESAFGPVDVLVNNASSWRQDSFRHERPDSVGRLPEPVSNETIRHNFAVDAVAAAALIAEFAARHIARGGEWGRIVGLTSGGPHGFPGEVSYGAAKAAQENYTMSAATELAGYGVTANLVRPPVTDTGWVTEAVRAFVASSGEHTHVAKPAEVAEVVAYLCSDAARLISGNLLRLR